MYYTVVVLSLNFMAFAMPLHLSSSPTPSPSGHLQARAYPVALSPPTVTADDLETLDQYIQATKDGHMDATDDHWIWLHSMTRANAQGKEVKAVVDSEKAQEAREAREKARSLQNEWVTRARADIDSKDSGVKARAIKQLDLYDRHVVQADKARSKAITRPFKIAAIVGAGGAAVAGVGGLAFSHYQQNVTEAINKSSNGKVNLKRDLSSLD